MNLGNFLQTASAVINGIAIAANAQIIFYQSSDNPIYIEDEVGNLVEQDGEEEAILECYLSQTKPPVADVQAGINLDSEYFKGRLVNPKVFNFPIKSTREIRVIINGREGLLTQLIVLESPASEQHNIKSYLGQRLACYVQFKQGN